MPFWSKREAKSPYRYNSKAALSRERQRAMSVGAILLQSNNDFHNSLESGEAASLKERKQSLVDWWGVSSPAEAIDTLDWLKNEGHRKHFDIVLKTYQHDLSLEDFMRMREEASISLFDDNISKAHPEAADLVKKHIGILSSIIYASSDEEADSLIEKHKSLFGDDEMLNLCFSIFVPMTYKFHDYAKHRNNLQQTLPKLLSRGFVTSEAELKRIDVTVWDMGRMVNVARWCYDSGYITESMAWEYIFAAYKESARCYADWAAFGKAYTVGRVIWIGDNERQDAMMDIVRDLLEHEQSPWRQILLK